MTLQELYDMHMSKSDFLGYLDRCLVFGVEACENVDFKIGRCNDIAIDISGIREEVVKIPGFVNTIYGFRSWSNYHIKELDLTHVNTIQPNGLAEFRHLEVLKGKEVIGIGEEGCAGCSNLKTVYLPKLETLGHNAFMWASNLKELHLPSLKYAKMGSFGFGHLQELYAPKLKALYPDTSYSYYNSWIMNAIFPEDVRIYKQNTLKFKIGDRVVNWFGEDLGTDGEMLGYETYFRNYLNDGVFYDKKRDDYYVIGLKIRY